MMPGRRGLWRITILNRGMLGSGIVGAGAGDMLVAGIMTGRGHGVGGRRVVSDRGPRFVQNPSRGGSKFSELVHG